MVLKMYGRSIESAKKSSVDIIQSVNSINCPIAMRRLDHTHCHSRLLTSNYD